MKKTIILALALALVGGAAYANFCARDTVPAATLLVPYILIDTDAAGNPLVNGNDTLTVVTNVSSAMQLIHVTVYSADSTPVIDFDEVLSGYDVWQINWRDLVNGDFQYFDTGTNLPNGFWKNAAGLGTATQGPAVQAWGPTANNTNPALIGAYDIDGSNAPGSLCGFPWHNQATYKPIITQMLQAPLYPIAGQDTVCNYGTSGIFGIPHWGGWLSSLGSTPLFFYAYIDAINVCNLHFPGDAAYWTAAYGGTARTALLSENNVLTGYDIYMNPTLNYSESLPTVNVEAATSWNGIGLYSHEKIATSGGTGTNANQDREPLPTAWAFNFMNNGGVTTDVAVWKNYDDFVYATDGVTVIGAAACRPYIYYAFDENEQSLSSTSQICPSPNIFCLAPEPNVFPFQTQKVAVTPANFDGLPTTGTQNFGWMLLVFDPSIPNLQTNNHIDTYLQTYVFAKYNYGSYTTSVEATVMSNYWCFGTAQQLPYLNTYNGAFGTYGTPSVATVFE